MKLSKLILYLLALVTGANCFAEVEDFNKMSWDSRAPELIAGKGQKIQVGLAGAYSGVLKVTDAKGVESEVMILAGGANFSEKPLVEAFKEDVVPKKIYHKDIFILSKVNGKYQWKLSGLQLPNGAAYGASVVYENSILLIGGEVLGEDGNARASNKILRLTYLDGKIKIDDFASLPVNPKAGPEAKSENFTFAKGGALLLGHKLYVIGAMTRVLSKKDGKEVVQKKASSVSQQYLKVLDLKNYAESKVVSWVDLKSYPGAARQGFVTVEQGGGFKDQAVFYVFSGAQKIYKGTLDAQGKNLTQTTLTTSGYAYLPKSNEWKETSAIKIHGTDEAVSLLGASAIKVGIHSILFFGGYNKQVFDTWLAKNEAASVSQAERIAFFGQKPEDFNWNKEILSYNTVTNSFISLGEATFAPNCGAVLQKMNGEYILTNGEIMPGVRTPSMQIGKFTHEPSFGMINWTVLVLYFMGMIYLGYYFMKRENSAEDFMTGGGRIPWWAAGVSIFATMLSSISFIAIPAMTYSSDWKVFFAAVMILACVPVICALYLPFFRRLKLTSAYEYLEARFNNASRSLSSIIFMLYMVGRIGIVLFLPSIALSAVTGINVITCIVVIGIITILYCMMGGIEAVIWGDFIQGIVLVGGAILAAVYLAMGTSGDGVVATAEAADKFAILDFAFDPSRPTFWVILIGGFFTNLASYTSDQSVVQRYLTTADEAGAKKSLWLNGILAIPVSAIFYYIGTTLYTFYSTNPESMNVAIESKNQIFPHFMMSKLPVGLAGLLIAAVFSATMSTLSSNINSAATAYVTDFYKRFKPSVTDPQCLRMARFLTVIIGSVGICIACVVATLDVDIFIFFNMVSGMFLSGLGGLFAMGIFTKNISGKAAFLALIVNAIAMFILKENYDLHGFVWGFVGMFTTFIVGFLLSFIFPQKKDITGLTIYTINELGKS